MVGSPGRQGPPPFRRVPGESLHTCGGFFAGSEPNREESHGGDPRVTTAPFAQGDRSVTRPVRSTCQGAGPGSRDSDLRRSGRHDLLLRPRHVDNHEAGRRRYLRPSHSSDGIGPLRSRCTAGPDRAFPPTVVTTIVVDEHGEHRSDVVHGDTLHSVRVARLDIVLGQSRLPLLDFRREVP